MVGAGGWLAAVDENRSLYNCIYPLVFSDEVLLFAKSPPREAVPSRLQSTYRIRFGLQSMQRVRSASLLHIDHCYNVLPTIIIIRPNNCGKLSSNYNESGYVPEL